MKTADQIGNPRDLLGHYNDMLNRLGRLEAKLPEAQAGQALLEGLTDQQAYELRTRGTPEERASIQAWRQVVLDAKIQVKYGLEYLQRVGARHLFYAILQQYRLDPRTRKEIEAAAKYFSKKRQNRPDDLTAIATYQKQMVSWRAMGAAAARAIQDGQVRTDEGGDDTTQAGPFRVIDTGGFDPSVLAGTAQIIEDAAVRLTAKGLDRICYGDIHLSRTINRANVLAFYLPSKDEMFVRANLKGQEKEALSTIVHELGHRWETKYLDAVQLKDLYRATARLDQTGQADRVREMLPNRGETLTIKGTTYTVTGVESTRAGVKVLMDYPAGKARIGLESFAHHKGNRAASIGFVTDYARTNPAENFAEMFAYYVLDRLTPEQTALILPLLT